MKKKIKIWNSDGDSGPVGHSVQTVVIRVFKVVSTGSLFLNQTKDVLRNVNLTYYRQNY